MLDALRKYEPQVAWRLLIALLPEHIGTVVRTHDVKWRDWEPDVRPEVTPPELIEATTAVLERLLADVQADPHRWCDLIAHADNLFIEQRQMLLKRMDELDPSVFSATDRSIICDCLRKTTLRHREFADAAWAMPMADVERLEAIYTRLEPEDLIARHGWLFSNRVSVLEMRPSTWEQGINVVAEFRHDALQEILTVHGWEGVLRR